MLTKRTNILFDEGLWRKLVDLARSQNTSVGNLIRKAVAEKYADEDELKARRKTVEAIKKHRKIFKGKIDYKLLINYGRKY